MNEVTRTPVDTPMITQNHAGQPCYLVEYDEDQWKRYDKEGQEHCFEQWAKKAKPLGAVFVVLKLFPDPVFPSGDKTAPYVFRSYPVEQETFNPVTVTCRLTATIDPDTWEHASEGARINMRTAARQQLAMHAIAQAFANGCAYEICTREGKEWRSLEKGRL